MQALLELGVLFQMKDEVPNFLLVVGQGVTLNSSRLGVMSLPCDLSNSAVENLLYVKIPLKSITHEILRVLEALCQEPGKRPNVYFLLHDSRFHFIMLLCLNMLHIVCVVNVS